MIIDITKCGYRRGYLPKDGVGVFHAFFPTANAAFRKDALQRVGGFDPRCATGEDIDLCIRLSRADYELWFEPSARVTHFHRYTLRGLARQWFHYGYGHAYLFRKHGARHRLEFYRYDLSERNDSTFGIARVLGVPFPVPGMVFLSSFHAFHLCLAVALVGVAMGAATPAWFAAGGALAAAGRYVVPRFELARPARSLAMAGIRYLADAAYVMGGLLGGMRQRMIFLEATFRTRKAAPSRTPAPHRPGGEAADRGMLEPMSLPEGSDAG
ncbi:MAG TPA: glycosyltransferase family 2 protein [Gemmatimonadales bacterium]|nr:glycosyltransferase family 2 protein [Gemmatimonadales bacterium]